MTNHCQICERDIKANNKKGLIAHHGYERPDRGSGWQTASCMGARYLPYEKSCDRIPVAIDMIKRHIENKTKYINDMMENPPEELNDRYAHMYRQEVKPYKRPEGFNAKENLDSSYPSNGYEYEHRSAVSRAKRDIKMAKVDQERLKKRLADWIPPAK